MSYLCLLIEPRLSVTLFEHCSKDAIRLNGDVFTLRIMEGMDGVVFYDWIRDSTGAIRALEIHVPPENLLETSTPQAQIPYIETDCFFRVWFTDSRNGVPLGKEAFGDILFFQAEDGRLAVVVGIQEWLSAIERERLLADLGLVST